MSLGADGSFGDTEHFFLDTDNSIDLAQKKLENETVQRWRDQIEHAPYLSSRFKSRYAILLAVKEEQCDKPRRNLAFEVSALCPHLALLLLENHKTLNISIDDIGESLANDTNIAERTVRWLPNSSPYDFDQLQQNTIIVIGQGDAAAAAIYITSIVNNLHYYISAQAPLEQTQVPIHPSRQGRLVRIPGKPQLSFVALKWSRYSLAERHLNQSTFASEVLVKVGSSDINFKAAEDYAWVFHEESEDPWVLAPNYGKTLEDELREDTFTKTQRSDIVGALTRLRAAMTSRNLIWSGFAPRNMFFDGKTIILIDFEKVIDATIYPQEAANAMFWHRVFFADCLTLAEAEILFFDDLNFPQPQPEETLPADRFEKALQVREKISWRERTELLSISMIIEGQHSRRSMERDSGVLYGHQLGHFWGDFIHVQQEVFIFNFLRKALSSSATTLDDVMEVFEVAMEADILDTMESAVSGITVDAKYHTLLSSIIQRVTVSDVQAVRKDYQDWYVRLETEPRRLISNVIGKLTDCSVGIQSNFVTNRFIGDSKTRLTHAEALNSALKIGLRFMHGDNRNNKFLQYKKPKQLKSLLEESLPSDGLPLSSVLSEFESEIAAYSICQSDKRYLAFPDAGNLTASLVGAILAPMLNQNLIAMDRSAPAAIFIEAQVIEWLRKLVGYSAVGLTKLSGVRDMAGLWTTGGHMSNHIAMLAALGKYFPDVRENGLNTLESSPSIIMSGPIAHYSHQDAAIHLGVGANNILMVEANTNFTTSVSEVEKILRTPPSGKTPFMVIGVAGNCRTTTIDDLAALYEVCKKYDVWFHVDACHGGSLLFSDTLRTKKLKGIEFSDSISIDPHKGLFTPYPSSYILFKERGQLSQFSRHFDTVREEDCWDLGLITPFLGSRGFDSLKTWFMIKNLGINKIGALVERRYRLMQHLEVYLGRSSYFIIFNELDLYRLTFVFCPKDLMQKFSALDPHVKTLTANLISNHTSKLNSELYSSGSLCVDEHTLIDMGGRVGLGASMKYTVMAISIGNPLLNEDDIDSAVEVLNDKARIRAEAFRADFCIGSQDSLHVSSFSGPAGWS